MAASRTLLLPGTPKQGGREGGRPHGALLHPRAPCHGAHVGRPGFWGVCVCVSGCVAGDSGRLCEPSLETAGCAPREGTLLHPPSHLSAGSRANHPTSGPGGRGRGRLRGGGAGQQLHLLHLLRLPIANREEPPEFPRARTSAVRVPIARPAPRAPERSSAPWCAWCAPVLPAPALTTAPRPAGDQICSALLCSARLLSARPGPLGSSQPPGGGSGGAAAVTRRPRGGKRRPARPRRAATAGNKGDKAGPAPRLPPRPQPPPPGPRTHSHSKPWGFGDSAPHPGGRPGNVGRATPGASPG